MGARTRAMHQRDARTLRRGAGGLRRRPRAVAGRTAPDVARRLTDSRSRRTRQVPARRSSPDAASRRCSLADVARARVETGWHVMARKTSFYYSFLVLPGDQRQAIESVWDFCRVVDDAVDEPEEIAREIGEAAAGRAAVPFWRAELGRCFDGQAPLTSQGRHLQPFIRQLDLPRQAFEDVIDGVAMDLDTHRYQTFADLVQYCRRVASAVGMICIKIFGCRNEGARDYALNPGVALQLTNIIRDTPDDLARGRVYLPLEDLAAYDC